MRKLFGRLVVVLCLGVPALAMPVAAAAPLITAGMLADGAVTRSKIAYGAIDGDRIADRSITLNKLAVLTVLTTNIGDGVVTTPKLADKAVGRRKLANRAVNTAKLALGAVNSKKIKDKSVKRVDLAPDSVNSEKVIDGSLTAADIAAGAVSAAEVAVNSITGDKVADGSLTGADIADGSLSQSKFPLALVAPQEGWRIESGETTISTEAAAPWVNTVTVSFARAFNAPPVLFVSFKDFTNITGVSAENLSANPTTAQFTAKTRVTTGAPGSYATVSWLAIGR